MSDLLEQASHNTNQIEMNIEEPKDTKKQNSIEFFFNCVAVSLLSIGYGFALKIQPLIKHLECPEITNSTLITANETTTITALADNSDVECVSKFEMAFYVPMIYFGALFVPLIFSKVKMSRTGWLAMSSCLYASGFIINVHGMFYTFRAILSRFIVGLGLGISKVRISPYLNDNAPESIKSYMKLTAPIFIAFGTVLSSIFAIILNEEGQSYSYVLIAYGIFFSVLAVIYSKIKDNVSDINGENSHPMNLKEEVKNNWRSLVGLMIMHANQQLSLIHGILLFSHDIFSKDTSISTGILAIPKYCTLILTCILFIGTIVSIPLMKLVDDFKLVYFFSNFLTMICLLLLAFTPYTTIFAFAYMFFFAIGLSPIVFIIAPSLFDKRFVEIGITFGNSTNWICSFLVPVIFKLIYSDAHKGYIFATGASFLFISGIAIYFLMDLKTSFEHFFSKISGKPIKKNEQVLEIKD